MLSTPNLLFANVTHRFESRQSAGQLDPFTIDSLIGRFPNGWKVGQDGENDMTATAR